MDSFFVAVILGIVEGITEFLPISSTGHLILVNKVVGFTGEFAQMFDVVIQLGAILSVVVYFWSKLWPWGRGKTAAQRAETWDLWKKAIVGVMPAIIIGAALGSHVHRLLFNPVTVGAALVIGGIILILLERRGKTGEKESIAQLSYKTVLLIGLIQCLAMIPGTSRSAATIIGAMALGASRYLAVEYSFYLAIPTMVAASGYSLLSVGASLEVAQWLMLAVGFAVSFVVALLVIAALMRYIRTKTFIPFGYYRIVLGLLVLVLCYRY